LRGRGRPVKVACREIHRRQSKDNHLEETYRKALLEWHFQWDNPDFCGWSVVAAYLIAAILCARAALGREGNLRSQAAGMWWLLAGGLFFLGVNKQLNLQTLLIVLGRRAAFAGGWYEQRRMVQMIFSLVLTIAGLTALWLLRARFRRFFAGNPWAFKGVMVLCFFVLLRAASISHVLEAAGVPDDDAHDDKRWTWILEMGGSACLAVAAVKARSATVKGESP
jgi:hypothetical protein